MSISPFVRVRPLSLLPMRGRGTIRRRLLGLSWVGVLAFGINYQVASQALNDADAAAVRLAAISDAVKVAQDLGELHDELLAAVRLAFIDSALTTVSPSQMEAELTRLSIAALSARAELTGLALSADLVQEAISISAATEEDLAAAIRTIDDAMEFSHLDGAALKSFETLSASNEHRSDASLASMVSRRAEARQFAAAQTKGERLTLLIGSAVGAFAFLWAGFLVQFTLSRCLRRLGRTAEAIARGELGTRASEQGPGEAVELARSLNTLSDSLQAMINGYQANAARDAFDSGLAEALEMDDSEYETFGIIAEAMREIDPTLPMELLIADPLHAHMQRAAFSPEGGAPGCNVDSPWSCVAVRRGSMMSFDSSRALNSCPQLKNRPSGPCSAVCVPLTFMGNALGILHVASAEGAAPDKAQIEGIRTLAKVSGARIGTLRALAQAQIQAMTDALTGLSNRRDAEARMQRLLERNDRLAGRATVVHRQFRPRQQVFVEICGATHPVS